MARAGPTAASQRVLLSVLYRRDRQKEVRCHPGWLHADTHSLNVRLSASPCLPQHSVDTSLIQSEGFKLQLVSPCRRCVLQDLGCAQTLWLLTLAVGEAQVEMGCRDLHQEGQEGQQLPAASHQLLLCTMAAHPHHSSPERSTRGGFSSFFPFTSAMLKLWFVQTAVLPPLQQRLTRTGNGLKKGSKDTSDCKTDGSGGICLRSMKSQVPGEEDRTSFAPAHSVPGLREASNQASRNHVQNEGRERRLCASGSGAGETVSTGH